MLKKLRIRFIGITMAIVLGMLGIIFSLVFHTTRQNLERESIRTLERIASTPQNRPRLGVDNASMAYFTVEIDPFGNASVIGESLYDIENADFIREIVQIARESEDDTGLIPPYHLRFYKSAVPSLSGSFFGAFGKFSGSSLFAGEYIIYGDVSGDEVILRNLRKTCCLVGAGSMLVFWAISILLARWAVRPVEKAWRKQKQFISDASHELKTPLTVIATNAEMLKDAETAGDKYVENILTTSRQMRGLVENLLELARMDSGAVKKTFRPLNFSLLTEDAVLPFEPIFFEAGLNLKSEVEADICVSGSAAHLREVINVLLDNACKYSRSPGEVQLTLRQEDHGHCRLSVFSPGEPLNAENREKIFLRLYRVDESRSGNRGYGLGLAIAKSIVDNHDGKIWCEALPKGNVFHVRLKTG